MIFPRLFLLIIIKLFPDSNGRLLPDQLPELREHFFSVIHVLERTDSATRFAKYQPYPEDGQVRLDALRRFENPCAFEGKDDLNGLEVSVQLPCKNNYTEFLDVFTKTRITNFGPCKFDFTAKLRYSTSIARYENSKWQLPNIDLAGYKTKLNLSEYPDQERPILRISYWSGNCLLNCSENVTIANNVQCGALSSKKEEVEVCNFSSKKPCLWRSIPENAYKFEMWNHSIGVGGSKKFTPAGVISAHLPANPSPVQPMLASPYYLQTASTCEMELVYQIIGLIGHTRLVVATQSRPDTNSSSIRTVHAILQATYAIDQVLITSSPIHLGHFREPTRIQIECQNANYVDQYSIPTHRRIETTCTIHSIKFYGCEEHPDFKDLCPDEKEEYLCKGETIRKCIPHGHLCDGETDCPLGDDEEDCEWPVPGSRCDFEDENELCPGWTTHTSEINHNQEINQPILERFTFTQASKETEHNNLPHRDVSTKSINGHFLWSTRKFHKDREIGAYMQKFVSPFFPPTIQHDDESHETCYIRWWYCEKNEDQESIVVTWNAYPAFTGPELMRGGLPIYFQKETRLPLKNHCEWSRAAVKLKPQRAPFQIAFSFSVFHTDKYFYMMDDVSLSPSCFRKENPLEVWHEMDTCGATGYTPPTTEKCLSLINGTSKAKDPPDFVNGVQHWTVPKTMQYRLEVCGAAGGSLPPSPMVQPLNNWGGCVHSIVHLEAYQVLSVILGQRGESPCEREQDDPFCFRMHGSGGGGASTVRLNDQPILVAGGGGGLFFDQRTKVDEDEEMAMGGRKWSNESWIQLLNETKQHKNPNQDSEMIVSNRYAGYGSFLRPRSMTRTSQMNGDVETADGGTCEDSESTARGGFGGGGASCGKGGGGGGGFIGGSPGMNGPGTGGSSWVDAETIRLEQMVSFRAGLNYEDGRFIIYACPKKCPEGAECVFDNPTDLSAHCLCSKTRIILIEHDVCLVDSQPPSSSFFFSVPFLLILLCFLLSIGYCSYVLMRKRSRRAERKQAYHHEMEARIRANLVTEISAEQQRREAEEDHEQMKVQLEDIKDLPYIERNRIILLEPLGTGAFGEVFKAKMKDDRGNVEVAVKTLPFSSNKHSQDEFLMEAQIMNKFRHNNIVSLFGVNFEVMPHYIVLELMNGGDLKSYLRNSRATKMDPNPNNLLMLDLVLMCLDVAKGCEFLEANKFIHRDIAARNCLLTSVGADRCVKIGDFGMARDVYRTDYYRKGGRAMLPVKWMPPEALLDGYFTTKTDVWSFGILIWEVFSLGYMPYPGRNNMEVLDLITKGGRLEPPIGTPFQIYQIMLQCWKTNEETRPAFTTIIFWLQKLVEDPVIRQQPIPDRNLSIPSTALQTPCVETPRSEMTVTTGLNSPSPSHEAIDTSCTSGPINDDFTCVVSSPYVSKFFAQGIVGTKQQQASQIQPIIEEALSDGNREDPPSYPPFPGPETMAGPSNINFAFLPSPESLQLDGPLLQSPEGTISNFVPPPRRTRPTSLCTNAQPFPH